MRLYAISKHHVCPIASRFLFCDDTRFLTKFNSGRPNHPVTFVTNANPCEGQDLRARATNFPQPIMKSVRIKSLNSASLNLLQIRTLGYSAENPMDNRL